jgi:hypothetical protein
VSLPESPDFIPRAVRTPNGGLSVFGEDCAQGHTALIYDRGGSRRLHQLVDLSSVEWGRTRDGKSQGIVRVSGRACRAQASILANVEPRRHELRLYRGNEVAWEGPIVQGGWFADHAEFVANDVLEYLDGTALSRDWPNEDGGGPRLMTDRIEQIIDWELTQDYAATVGTGGAAHGIVVPRWENIDAPANVLPFVDIRSSSTLLTRSSTLAFEMTVGEHLYNLGRGGLDYTTSGRTLLIWDSAQSIGRTRVLTEADFYGDMEVIGAGTDHFSISHISARREDSDGNEVNGVGSAGGENDYYGVWTNIVTLASEEGSADPTQDELNSQAQRDQVGRTPVPTVLRVADGAGLRLSGSLNINVLVPGVEVPVRATLNLREVQQTQILDKIKVVETAAGENIQVSLIPSGVVEAV